MFYCPGNVKITVGKMVLGVYPAVGRIAVSGVAGVLSGAFDSRARTYYSLCQGRYRRAGLEC